MEIKIIKVKATLVRASKLDLFTNSEVPRENKLFFYKHPLKNEFTDTYRIAGVDYYDIIELYKAMQLGVLYMLTENHNHNDYCFKLVLRTAEQFDFFDTPNWIKPNVLYYQKQSDTSIIGPLYIDSFTNIERIKSLLAAGKLFVPGKQTFEPFLLKQAS